MEKRRAALVLAGGGARGVAHIGAIEELESQGFEVHAVAGTSMGALVGGMYASGHLEAFKEWMYTLDKYKVFSLVDFALSTEGLVKGNRVIGAMKELVPDVKIEQMPLPFAAGPRASWCPTTAAGCWISVPPRRRCCPPLPTPWATGSWCWWTAVRSIRFR